MTKDVVKHYRMTTKDARVFHEKAEQAGMTEAEYFRLLITQQPNDYLEIRSGLKDFVNDQREQTRLRWAKLRDVLLEV